VTSPENPLVKPGDIVRIARHDYLDGGGDVTVRIAWIGRGLDKVRQLEWLRILVTDPEQPDTAPEQPKAEPRLLIVRVAALRQPHTPPDQPDQQTGPPTEFVSAATSYGPRIPSPRGPSGMTARSVER
jgi:hypothetical protein